MRAFRRFTVRPVLPEPLGALSVLAGNLRWSWHPPTQDVFESIDPQVWREVAKDPVRFLGAVGRERLDELVDDADLYPGAVAAAIRESERGVAEDLQTAGRHLTFGALYFRPESLGTFAGTGPLDPAGTDFAIKLARGAWRYIGITAEKIAQELAALPEQLDIVDELIEGGVVGGDEPTAVDYQIGSSLHLLLQIGDVRPLIEGRPAEKLVDAWFERGPADIPAGAFPAGWVPERSAQSAA